MYYQNMTCGYVGQVGSNPRIVDFPGIKTRLPIAICKPVELPEGFEIEAHNRAIFYRVDIMQKEAASKYGAGTGGTGRTDLTSGGYSPGNSPFAARHDH